jgi:hypothetical protein
VVRIEPNLGPLVSLGAVVLQWLTLHDRGKSYSARLESIQVSRLRVTHNDKEEHDKKKRASHKICWPKRVVIRTGRRAAGSTPIEVAGQWLLFPSYHGAWRASHFSSGLSDFMQMKVRRRRQGREK